jgi:hypothetical protein
MRDFDPTASFGEDVAATYDDMPRGDELETVACLRRLAGNGPALELAIGTGRIGLPLAATGIRVDGIELSAAMIARLRAKPGGGALSVIQGNMADVAVAGRYPLVFVVFNSIFNLITQDEQVRCFTNVAEHLEDGGVFLVEAALPGADAAPGPPYRLEQQYVAPAQLDRDRVVLEVGRYDPVTQLLEKSHVTFDEAGVRLNPLVLRFAWPSELDLMARLAGLHLQSRWGGWNGESLTPLSRRHISLYAKSSPR